MSSIRFSFVLLTALQALSACANHPDSTAPTGPAVPMPQLSAAIANSTPEEARRAISNKTWLWTLGAGPYPIGRDDRVRAQANAGYGRFLASIFAAPPRP